MATLYFPLSTQYASLLQGLYQDDEVSHWPVDNYFDETERIQSWFVDGVLKYYRSVESYVSSLLEKGFAIQGLAEPKPSEWHLNQYPHLALHGRRPALLVIKAGK